MKPSASLAVAVIVVATPTWANELFAGAEIETVGALPIAAATFKVTAGESKVVVPSLAVTRATKE